METMCEVAKIMFWYMVVMGFFACLGAWGERRARRTQDPNRPPLSDAEIQRRIEEHIDSHDRNWYPPQVW
ncbi:hypothetical protein HY632_00060 [Candidatus Uhrbacteria bacterium]|nr:hypothetical protein [Candidatus Uhrbacteria bacterium]